MERLVLHAFVLVAAGVVMADAGAQRSSIGRRHLVDAELALDLRGWAVRLSGLHPPAGTPMPAFVALADAVLAQTVCPTEPRGCGGIVAAYDTDRVRIVYRDSLDMRDPTDQSFIVHELVHWLQHLTRGDRLYENCRAVLAAERAAYAAQNEYLARFKQWQRVGDVMRFTFCREDAAANEEPIVRFDASSGPITAGQGVSAPSRQPD